MAPGFLADIDPFGPLTNVLQKLGRNEVVIHDAVGLPQAGDPLQRDQTGISRTSSHEKDLTFDHAVALW
jgi:hypothetical protein